MSEQTEQVAGDDQPRVGAAQEARSPGKLGTFSRSVAKRPFLIVAVVVVIMIVLIGTRGCGADPLPKQNLGVNTAPKKEASSPSDTSDYVADGIKERDAKMAEAVGRSPEAIKGGAAYMPELTREWSDPLADYASATSRSTLTDTIVSAQPTAAPVGTPVPQRRNSSTLEQQAGHPRAEKMLAALKAHEANGTSTLTLASTQAATLGTWKPSATPVPAAGAQRASSGPEGRAKKLANLGDVLYAVVDFEANSDHSKFVQATSVAGPFAGAKFQGNFTRTMDRLEITFSRVNWKGQTYPLSAIAANPENPEIGLATEVNHHYLQRYGGVVLAAMVGAAGEQVAREGTTIRRGPLGEVDIETEKRSTEDLVKIGVGAGALEVRNALRDNINRPPTVIVAANTPIGIVLTQDWLDVPPDRVTTPAFTPATPAPQAAASATYAPAYVDPYASASPYTDERRVQRVRANLVGAQP